MCKEESLRTREGKRLSGKEESFKGVLLAGGVGCGVWEQVIEYNKSCNLLIRKMQIKSK